MPTLENNASKKKPDKIGFLFIFYEKMQKTI